MNNETTATCQHCKKEVPPDRVGPCPYCGKVGKDITVTLSDVIELKASAVSVVTSVVRAHLDKDERGLWDKLVIFFKDNIIVDGFEIGFPSGIKIKFKTKKAQK